MDIDSCDILDNDDIVVTREYTILNMVLRWLENKRVNIDDFTKVMFVIRFNFITYSELTNAIQTTLTGSIPYEKLRVLDTLITSYD